MRKGTETLTNCVTVTTLVWFAAQTVKENEVFWKRMQSRGFSENIELFTDAISSVELPASAKPARIRRIKPVKKAITFHSPCFNSQSLTKIFRPTNFHANESIK